MSHERLHIHTYSPDDTGRCLYPWVDSRGQARVCGSRQQSSVLHDDPAAQFREDHWHSGGDCMCFEGTEGGYYGAMARFVAAMRDL